MLPRVYTHMTRHLDRKLKRLAQVPLLASLPQRERRRIASAADELDIPEGRVLTVEGASGHEFFVLLEGAAEVRRRGRLVSTLGPGDFFGEIALLGDRPRTATVTATARSRVLVLAEREFRSIAPTLSPVLLPAVARRLAT